VEGGKRRSGGRGLQEKRPQAGRSEGDPEGKNGRNGAEMGAMGWQPGLSGSESGWDCECRGWRAWPSSTPLARDAHKRHKTAERGRDEAAHSPRGAHHEAQLAQLATKRWGTAKTRRGGPCTRPGTVGGPLLFLADLAGLLLPPTPLSRHILARIGRLKPNAPTDQLAR